MKEKRYYCDWALSSTEEKTYLLIRKLLFISLIVITSISSLIYYNIMKNNLSKDLEAYSGSVYKETDNNVIGEARNSIATIPDNVIKKEEYATSHKIGFYISILIFGVLTWGVIAIAICTVMGVAIPISMIHKKRDMEKYLS